MQYVLILSSKFHRFTFKLKKERRKFNNFSCKRPFIHSPSILPPKLANYNFANLGGSIHYSRDVTLRGIWPGPQSPMTSLTPGMCHVSHWRFSVMKPRCRPEREMCRNEFAICWVCMESWYLDFRFTCLWNISEIEYLFIYILLFNLV